MKVMQTTDELTVRVLEIKKSEAASDLYRLLSMFLHQPTDESVQGLLDGSIADDVADILEELGFSAEIIQRIDKKLTALQNGISKKEELRTAMSREYTRLFSHPKKPAVAIYECLFLFQPENETEEQPLLFVSPAALDAERCYKKAGLLRSKAVNEPGDHMATELEFMMVLYWRKAQALQENNLEELAKSEAEIKEFTDVHLRKWAVEFFQQCVDASQSEVYRIFGEIGRIFISKMLSS